MPRLELALAAEVQIELGRLQAVSDHALGGYSGIVAANGEVQLAWRDVGLFAIRAGREIVVDPAPSVSHRVLRRYLLGPVLAVLLHQRGLLVLHASGMELDGGAVAFLGASGWGKSTVAAALHRRVHLLISDDVVAIDMTGCPEVLPGISQLKLWPDALASLGEDATVLPRVHPQIEKRVRAVERPPLIGPIPLERVYVLADAPALAIEPLSPREALVELLRHSYGARTLQAIRTAEHFQQCARVAADVPVSCLRFPRSFALLDQVARLVEEDCGHAP